MQQYRQAGFDGTSCKRAASISASTASAKCSKEDDRQKIISIVSSVYIEGGFRALDKLIEQFRQENLPTKKDIVDKAVELWTGKREDLIASLAGRLVKDTYRPEVRQAAAQALGAQAEEGDEVAMDAL
eukprot:945907-Amphidinium_carterae.1